MAHQHSATRVVQDLPFTGTARGAHTPQGGGEVRAAQGGVRVLEGCGCGFTRETNRNSNRVEVGAWLPAHPDHRNILKGS